MNHLIVQTNDSAITSQDIATLVQSRHDKVKQSIERLAGNGIIAQPPMGNGIKSGNGVVAQHYIFSGNQGRIDSIIVVSQLSPKFTAALVHRWDQLEQSVANALPDFTNPAAAARAYADQYEAKQLAQEQLAIAQPKVNFYDSVAASKLTMAVSDVAKKIGMTAQQLNIKLIAIGAYDERRLPKKVFNTGFIKKGYGEMSLTAEGRDCNRLTQSGQIYIINRFGSKQVSEAV